MGRPTKKQSFIKYLFNEIESEPYWEDYKEALYKEYILHLTTNSPRWLYEHLLHTAESYWDYMTKEVDPALTKEELITDMGEVFDTPITRKLIQGLTGVTAL